MRSPSRLRASGSLIGTLLLTSACGNTPASISSSLKVVGSGSPAMPSGAPTGADIFRASPSGQTGPGSVQTLKYNIQHIAVCEDMTVSGDSFYPAHCLTLLQRATDPRFEYTDGSQDLSAQADVARGNDEGFVDLMDATSRGTLDARVALESADAHAYNWGFVSWYLPVKVLADVALSDGSSLHTHDGSTSVESTPAGSAPAGSQYRTAASMSLVTGPASSAVAMLSSGGTWFRLQKSLNVTNQDIQSGADLTLDLAFNPEGMIKGSASTPAGTSGFYDAEGHSIELPDLDIAAIPHRASETVVREIYIASVSGTSSHGSDNFDVRIELYFIKQDASKSVYAVAVTTLANMFTQHAFTTVPKIASVQMNGDGSIDLLDSGQNVVVAGFQRLASVGVAATADLVCSTGSVLHFASCGENDAPGAQTVSFTLTATTEL